LWCCNSQRCTVACDITTLQLWQHCDATAMATLQHYSTQRCDATTMVMLQFMMLRRCEEVNVFFSSSSYLTFTYCLLSVHLCSSSPHKSIVEWKKKTKDTHKGESEGTKENDYIDHLNKRIFNTCVLDLDVAVGSKNTTTHGHIRFVEVASVLLNNKFAQ